MNLTVGGATTGGPQVFGSVTKEEGREVTARRAENGANGSRRG